MKRLRISTFFLLVVIFQVARTIAVRKSKCQEGAQPAPSNLDSFSVQDGQGPRIWSR